MATLKSIMERMGATKVSKAVVNEAIKAGIKPGAISKQAKSLGANVGVAAQSALSRARQFSGSKSGGGRDKGSSLPRGAASSGGSLAQEGLGAIKSILQQNEGNDLITGRGYDSIFNYTDSVLQTAGDVTYAKKMMPLALEYARETQQIADSSDMRRMAAEGGIASDLMLTKGRIDTGIENIRAATDRYEADQIRNASNYGADRSVDRTRLESDALKYKSDNDLTGVRYGQDRETDRTRYTLASQEKQIGLKGDEDRKTITRQTDETIRLRMDARGAIARAGGRFYS